MTTLDWKHITSKASQIAGSYQTPPTLRQVYYRLVAAGIIPNKQTTYKSLSHHTAKARRAGWFPPLSDGTRDIRIPLAFDDPAHAIEAITRGYGVDRTAGQETQVWLGLEKATLETMAVSATRRFGIPVVALRGYGSQTIIDRMFAEMDEDGRPVTLLYVGDFDPTGEDIPRDMLDRLGMPVDYEQIAVSAQQVTDLNLPPMPGKASDARAAGFIERHGVLVQVEAEAIDPSDLSDMMFEAVSAHTDHGILDEQIDREAHDISTLREIARTM